MRIGIRTLAATLVALALTGTAGLAQRAAPDWAAVDRALGRSGAAQPGGVMKYGFPRSDLTVTKDGVRLRPALALGSWVAFVRAANGRAMLMGDLVLTEAEVAPVMRALQEGGIEPTALHNHLLGETPRVMYMHVAAQGDAATIARALRAALEQTGTPLGAPATAASAPVELDTAGIARALGVSGKVNGGVYQVSIPRREAIRDGHGGAVVPPAMGVATAINFQPIGGGRAVTTGDFVLRASEVGAVIRALRSAHIDVAALHSHMLDEQPRLFFMHFWGSDDAVALARGLRSALDHTGVRHAASR